MTPYDLQPVRERLLLPAMRFALCLASLIASGCATQSPQAVLSPPTGRSASAGDAADDLVQRCRHWLDRVDQTTRRFAVTDAETAKIPGFPYLRINRHLLAVNDQIATPRQAADWLKRLQQLDESARQTEVSNLPAHAIPDLLALAPESVTSRMPGSLKASEKPALLADIQSCALVLLDHDTHQTGQVGKIRSAAQVPDNYSSLRRVVGLYAMSRLGVAAGVRQWERDTQTLFREFDPLAAQPGNLNRVDTGWQRAGQQAASRLVNSRRQDSLGIPVLTREVKDWLLREFAPVFIVERDGPYDDPVAIQARADGAFTFDPTSPPIYTRVGFTRYGNESLIQLVYTVWFSERPAKTAFDIYAGALDGITVRLTLNRNGQPAVIDTIHPCGCYHQFFHTAHASPLARPAQLPAGDEWRFMPTHQLDAGDSDSLHVSIQSATHYVQKMSFEPKSPVAAPRARLIAERSLTRLSKGTGSETVSLYDTDGLVNGTERNERWLLWPMGIDSPGAMRQWGTHATAFVGRRHFDDADLIQTRFELR